MPYSATAPGDYSAYVGYAVRKTGAGTVALCTDPDVEPYGIIRTVAANGTSLTISAPGEVASAKIGTGGIAATDGSLRVDGDGRLVAAGTGHWIIGQSLWPQAFAEGTMAPIHISVWRRSSLLEA